MFFTTIREQPQASSDFNEVIARLDNQVYGTHSVPVTTRTAMTQATVYACDRILSEIIAQLPIDIQERQNGGWVTAENHRVKGVISEPNDWQTGHDFISFLVSWAELRGNSYYYKVYNGAGQVSRLLPVEADSTSVDVMQDMSLRYTVTTDYGINGVFDKNRILHHRNFGLVGYEGISTIGCHRRGIGLSIQLEQHADSAYDKGMQSNKWIEIEGLTQDNRAEYEPFVKSVSGSEKAGKIPYVPKDKMSINEFAGISLVDAQYIETRKMQKAEIASIFGVPMFLLNDTEKSTTWGSGLEQISRSFLRFSLNPRLNRIKQTLHRELIMPGAKRTTRIMFDTDQFTLGEFKDRMESYKTGIESGVLTANDALDLEGRNPREDGDKYKMPLNIGFEEDVMNGEANEPQPSTDEV